ncbi:MAG: YhbY family RNA-binding protein [Betaproteobacteria bacterium]|nr:YhbY family RNA-binding protein [Betaproteobacteria bacterium]
MKIILSPTERRALRARAHALEPVVMIGDQGLTAAVIREIDRSLKAHELIKVRAFNDERDERESWLDEICGALNAAPVQHIGKTLVIWRENPELARERKKAAQPPQNKKAPRRTKQQEENIAAGKTRRRPR